VNAESSIPAVRIRCGRCGAHVGTVHRVRGYRKAEELVTPKGQAPRETVIDDGLVVTGWWYDTTLPRSDRPPPIPLEWPVAGSELLVMCEAHGYLKMASEQVTAWGQEAAAAQRRIDRVAKHKGG
jgi:hypothetical protein